ncbi:DUF4418 family protein [Chloroflexota bacterium]
MNSMVEMFKQSNYMGWGVAIVGLLVVLTPVLFPVCQAMLELVSGKQVPMRCHWTANGEYVMGGLLTITGVLVAFTQSKEAFRNINVVVVLLGMAVVLLPIYFLPTCMHPEMACNLGTKPALIILGSIAVILGVFGSRRVNTDEAVE